MINSTKNMSLILAGFVGGIAFLIALGAVHPNAAQARRLPDQMVCYQLSYGWSNPSPSNTYSANCVQLSDTSNFRSLLFMEVLDEGWTMTESGDHTWVFERY